jgi:hypothetical protein
MVLLDDNFNLIAAAVEEGANCLHHYRCKLPAADRLFVVCPLSPLQISVDESSHRWAPMSL